MLRVVCFLFPVAQKKAKFHCTGTFLQVCYPTMVTRFRGQGGEREERAGSESEGGGGGSIL